MTQKFEPFKYSGWPSYVNDEVSAAVRVLESNNVNYWTGTECRKFEEEFAAWSQARYAVAVTNGTLALELALRAIGVGPGDEVVVTPRTFIASVSSIINVGAKPIFADVEPDSGNISSATIRAALTPACKAIICVHLGGMPCDMDPILELAKEFGLRVIEDCAQAHGAKYKGKSVGSIGDVGAWSFCQDKIMTTGGEGGMVTTNDKQLWSRMWSYKDHGKSYEAIYEKKKSHGSRWVHETIGSNFRMLEIQAAIGRAQLKKIEQWTKLRHRNAQILSSYLVNLHQTLKLDSINDQDITHAYYRVYAYVVQENLADGWSRDRILDECALRGLPVNYGTCPEVYLEKAFANLSLGEADQLPNAKKLGETALAFLVHPTLTESEMHRIGMGFTEIIRLASKT